VSWGTICCIVIAPTPADAIDSALLPSVSRPEWTREGAEERDARRNRLRYMHLLGLTKDAIFVRPATSADLMREAAIDVQLAAVTRRVSGRRG
jgi:hypothetical protein